MPVSSKLIVFDVDGTLVDSQADIIACMDAAFEGMDLPNPDRQAVLALVGLSLDVFMPKLAPDLSAQQHKQLIEAYKGAYMQRRLQVGAAVSSPLYEGALACLQRLNAMDHVVLGVATGKSKRGLDKLITAHGLEGMFVTQQVADFHPSKPHPAMLETAMADAGVTAKDAIMIGDTSFDMQMAANAGLRSIGVSWGYHSPEQLGEASAIVHHYDDLIPMIQTMWEETP